MSYISEHRRMEPVLEAARALDIATNPAPEAIFEAGSGGFQIWCTPDDHPEEWNDVPMTKGAFSKPCSYVASVFWGWEGERITHLCLSTDAYELSDHLGSAEGAQSEGRYALHNRPEDLAWAETKVRHLFQLAGVRIPPIVV
jgi:hypothetical protein